MVYNIKIVKMVIDIFGKGSEIFLAATKGEKLSPYIKASIKLKGKGAAYKMKEKKKLLELVLKMEEAVKPDVDAGAVV